MEKAQDCDEVGRVKVDRTTKYGHNFPESVTVDGVEGLSQVNESHVKILVLFLTFLVNLSAIKIMYVVPRDVLMPH